MDIGPAEAVADAAIASAPAMPSAIMRFFIIVFSMALWPREAADWHDNAKKYGPFRFTRQEAPVLTAS